jgi:hypothetical protein
MTLFALSHVAQAAPPSHMTKDDLRPAADAYSQAAKLPALSTHAGFELRVWSRDFMQGGVAGFVVTHGQLRLLNTSSSYVDGKVIVKAARLGTPIPVANVHKLEALVAKLEVRNGTTVTCPMLDGGSVLVHAVLDERIIMLRADNPWACADKTSKVVAQLMSELGREATTLCITRQEAAQDKTWITGFWRTTAPEGNAMSGDILVFRKGGTVVLYGNQYDPFAPQPMGRYRVVGDDVHVSITAPDEDAVPLTLHANQHRTELTFTIPDSGNSDTLERMPGRRCVDQKSLEVGSN